MKRKELLLSVFLHVFFVCFFIAIPYLTIAAQSEEIKHNKPHPVQHPDSIWVTAMYLRWCIQNAILAGLFYLTFFFIAPRFLTRQKSNILFVIFSLAAILIFIWLIYLFHYAVDHQIGRGALPFKIRFIESFLYCLAVVALGTGLHLFKVYRNLQQKQLESELLFLRSQINPHFLFNSLNNIYSLIILRSDNAANAMLRLSDLLRFVLYESSEKYIFLNKELKYIDDYISLQRIRLNENVVINYVVSENASGEMIHPMLLIPFIENAFKHGISYSEPCRIDIIINVQKGMLELVIKNTIFKNKTDEIKKDSGIGLKNVIRRLEILYPGKYEFDQSNDGKIYEVKLKLNLNES